MKKNTRQAGFYFQFNINGFPIPYGKEKPVWSEKLQNVLKL